ncbi:methyltransferase [Candidatus Woesearchaeota archaeon]|nr:methyltransferase [Candidatus Woesearchaeota archaeon]
MASCKSVYDPQEDSNMLEKHVRRLARGKVLDMGTGSGIQAIAAAQKNEVENVLAADIQKGVIDYCKKNIRNPKIKFIQSDLFEKVKEKFDVIIFNPPYLPQELKLKDLTAEGGKKGYEVIEKFLSQVNGFLQPDGVVLLVFSSLTKKEKVEEFIKNNLLDFEELEKRHIFFEDIHAYLLKKNDLLKQLEAKRISNVKYFAKGHRGLLFTGSYKHKKAAIKAKNPKSAAFGRIENEAKWLRRLNSHNIGPKLLFFDKNFLAYEFIEGEFIADYARKSGKNSIKKVIKNVFHQLFILDSLNIDKEEMHHPLKHIIVAKSRPCMIDFERCHYSPHPKNVTQFCQFLTSGKLSFILKSKKISVDRNKMIKLAKIYKNSPSKSNFKKITALI